MDEIKEMTIKECMDHALGDLYEKIVVCDVVNPTTFNNVFVGNYIDMPKEYNDQKLLSWEVVTQDGEPCICFNISIRGDY